MISKRLPGWRPAVLAPGGCGPPAHLVHELIRHRVQEVRVVQQRVQRLSKRLLVIRVLHCSATTEHSQQACWCQASLPLNGEGCVWIQASIQMCKTTKVPRHSTSFLASHTTCCTCIQQCTQSTCVHVCGSAMLQTASCTRSFDSLLMQCLHQPASSAHHVDTNITATAAKQPGTISRCCQNWFHDALLFRGLCGVPQQQTPHKVCRVTAADCSSCGAPL